jgi:L-ascorbate metabolism protein UlaG (beta-lactamase superfamily)
MRLQLIRHATLVYEVEGNSCLVDPMLSPAEAWDPVSNSANPRRNPMVELPIDSAELERLLGRLSAVFVTHTHADHWDDPAKERLPEAMPLFCQPHDSESIRSDGFTEVSAVDGKLSWNGLAIARTGGQHGTGEVAARIGPVSGFVIRADGEPTLYIAGDTIWCPEVADALREHQPEVVVVNAGAAQFLDSDPITMSDADVIETARAVPNATIVAVHMETINHCALTRAELTAAMQAQGLAKRVWIPRDGDVREF